MIESDENLQMDDGISTEVSEIEAEQDEADHDAG